MALEIRKVQVWCGEIEDRPGAAAGKLEQLAQTGADLEFVFTRPHPNKQGASILFLAPISGDEQIQIARAIGLAPALNAPMLYVQGPNYPGKGFELMSHLAVAEISLKGFSISAAKGEFGAYLAFESQDDTTKAIQVLATIE